MKLITNFNEVVTVNDNPVMFYFSMETGNVYEMYKVMSESPDSEFIMNNWVNNRYKLQYWDIGQLPEWIKADKELQIKLNDVIRKTWPKS